MLMTNNPYKVQKLDEIGIKVLGTVPVVVDKANEYNRQYISTKIERMNHMKELKQSLSLAPRRSVPKGGATAPPSDDFTATPTSKVSTDDLDGVVASDNGYCFGKQTVIDAIEATKRGELVVVVDDMDRENEGDLILAGSLATPATVSEMVRWTSGVLCVALPGEDMDRLNIPPMVANNQDPKGTAFGVSVDATRKHGITTGISGKDRATTINLMASGDSTADDFVRPGHIFPLRAREGGVLARDGHTEATVDLARLAGLQPAGVLCEIVSEEFEGEMARLPELRKFAKERGYVMTSIADMIAYRKEEGV
jgi:3,4-dihydroxy 2-butanone 4-phosphate synthase/GTP cyclohydrolase II